MGRRRSEKTKKRAKVVEALSELQEILEECGHKDGQPTSIEITVRGATEDSMTVELDDLSEFLEILKLNS